MERDYGTPRELTEVERARINETAHVHVYTYARDCDGRHEHEAITAPEGAFLHMSDYSADTDQEYADALLRTLVRYAASWSIPSYGAQTVTFTSHEDEDGNVTVGASYDTEEGGVSVSYEGCMNAGCGRGHISSRDLTAERAGY